MNYRRKYLSSCLLAIAALFSAASFNAALAQAATAPSLGSASGFAALAGTAVTCTDSTVTGNVGVWPGNAVTQTNCPVTGTVHAADVVAKKAYGDFINAYDNLAPLNNTCDSAHTLTGTLAGEYLFPGVYCVDAVAKTGPLFLDASGDPNAVWIFLVNGALTATNFDVFVFGGDPCNVYWWVKDAATLTTSNFQGTILAGADITVTGGTFNGDALATAAVTLKSTTVTACQASGGNAKCNQGVGNGPEGCDPGNSNNNNPSNDELGGTPGNPGRKP